MTKIKYLLFCVPLFSVPCKSFAAPDGNATTRGEVDATDSAVAVKPAPTRTPRRESLRESVGHGLPDAHLVLPSRQLTERELRELRQTIRAQRRDND